MTARRFIAWAALAAIASAAPAPAAWIWVEGESPTRSTMTRHPFWYDMVKRDRLSGGDFLSNWSDHPGEASYRAPVPASGEYDLWVRANPIQSRLSFRVGEGTWTPIDVGTGAVDSINVAADDKPDLRFLAWAKAGRVTLRKGDNLVRFRMDSPNNNHGYLDCFVLTDEPFRPRGTLKPGQDATVAAGDAERGWFAFDPKPDTFRPTSAIDLRGLNEKVAGEGGPIVARGSQFVHKTTGRPVRFWAVNGPSSKDRDGLREEAKILAKRGVNLVRIHHGYFDADGNLDLPAIRHAIEVVEALKAEGIYSHFSVYFPLWMTPKPDNRVLKGYDGKTHPFAALYFNKDFQALYRSWLKALLTTPSPTTGKTLAADPAVAGIEIVNEDSYFFWTFNDKGIPDTQLRIVEAQFAAWAEARHGSLETALRVWGGARLGRDNPAEGRLAFRPLWNLAHERTHRDRDTAAFLLESQRGFYSNTMDYLRGLGFGGMITASNWATASPEYLGPIEKYSYTVGDFIDRHGYFGCRNQGEAAEWSIRDGQTYVDRSALRFDPEEPGKAKVFVHPAMDPSYDGKPSMISETTWNRPNRHRPEAPLFFAAYGALQDSDAIVHFAFDGDRWSVKPGYFMQPWTLMAPSQMGLFPAAALIYRNGLVSTGDLLAEVRLKVSDVLDLKGTPLPQDAAFDELRALDLPRGGVGPPGGIIDPLIHLAGRTDLSFDQRAALTSSKDLSRLIDRRCKTVASSTGELRLDYDKGLLTINAAAAQGVVGALRGAGLVELKDLSIRSGLDVGQVVAVSLDGLPLATSRKILLQVMSEEKPTGWKTTPAGPGVSRIVSIGRDPWLVREIEGRVAFTRADASTLKVTALDGNGDPVRVVGHAGDLRLDPRTLYYAIRP